MDYRIYGKTHISGDFMKKRVLFLCSENSARSQMAEALLNQMKDIDFIAQSAGTTPTLVDPLAIEAMERLGLDTSPLHSKSVAAFLDQPFDYVITLCNKAQQECLQFENAKQHISWDFEDPKSRSDPKPYDTTLMELNERIRMFVLVQSKDNGTRP